MPESKQPARLRRERIYLTMVDVLCLLAETPTGGPSGMIDFLEGKVGRTSSRPLPRHPN